MAADAKPRLGRGLASLMGSSLPAVAPAPPPPRTPRKAPIEHLAANPRNPRRSFPQAELAELTASIRQHGIIQPIVVRSVKGAADRFEIIAGERRWRAAQVAGLADVPIVLAEVDDADALEIAIIENVQREDLNPIEEAQGYQALMTEFKRSAEDVARIVGKSRSHVANTMRLLKLPAEVQALVVAGALTAGHARALIGTSDPAALAHRIVAEGLTVREAEALAHDAGVPSRKAKDTPAPVERTEKDADTLAVEKRLSDLLGLRVAIDHKPDGGGAVTIRYRDLEQLDGIIAKLEQ